MSFPDESFWVVVGTAAPVIAVAVVVQLTDFMGTNDSIEQLRDAAGQAWPSIRGRSVILLYLVIFTALANLLLQGLALAFALSSLVKSENVVSTTAGASAVLAGVVLLIEAIGLNSFLLRSRRRIQAALRARAERPAEMHLHLHGVTADDLAALLARQQPPGGQQAG